jgi:hypothetical protein
LFASGRAAARLRDAGVSEALAKSNGLVQQRDFIDSKRLVATTAFATRGDPDSGEMPHMICGQVNLKGLRSDQIRTTELL